MHLCGINFARFLKEPYNFTSENLFGLLLKYNYSVLRYCVTLSSYELSEKKNDLDLQKQSVYEENGQLTKINEVLVYLDSLPHYTFSKIVRKMKREMAERTLNNLPTYMSHIHDVMNNTY